MTSQYTGRIVTPEEADKWNDSSTIVASVSASAINSLPLSGGTDTGPLKVQSTLTIQNSAGVPGDYIDQEGFKSVRYRDEYVGGEYALGTGGATPAVRTISLTGMEGEDSALTMRLYGFASKNSAFHVIYNTFEIPHDVALDKINDPESGVTMEMHVHWLPLGANDVTGNVVWEFRYMVINRNETPTGPYTARATIPVSANEQYMHKISPASEFPVPTPAPVIASLAIPAGGWKMGAVIPFLVQRLGSNASDTYGAEAGLLKAAMHVPVNDSGSRQRYTK